MTTIGDVFEIPESVHQGDFVLKLTEGVSADHATTTLRDYVVTEQIVRAFDQALSLTRTALQTCTSKGAYLHGSFGSGKSHFMAVLTLLLDGHTGARAIPELAQIVTNHGPWLGRRVLVVPLHLIGAPSLEAAVLEGYARLIRERHPEARTPGFYRGDALFQNAVELRRRMGEDSFFNALNERTEGNGGWGALASGWDATSFDTAVLLPSGDPERARLVGDLVDTFFSATPTLASAQEEGYVSMDDGLLELSRHAQALGYEGVVLFLDEVMLWLASHATDRHFLTREAHKLVKLVEAGNMARPIPIVSFLARQRNLRELVSEHLAGAEQLAVSDVLQHWEGRFDTVTLEDRNLPTVIEKRLLRPKNAQARALIAEAHTKTERIREEVMSVLLTREGDRALFRQVYPFSPVLVQALIALSSLLQRERTALKLLVQLLVLRRDLPLGDVMPAGDLWDVIERGEEPFSAVLRERFTQAKRLWRGKFLPLLEDESTKALGQGVAPDTVDLRRREDARLLKTLLLAALAEGVETLGQLTAARLAALNHGTVRSHIPGEEARVVLQKLRQWAGRVGEIKLGTGPNPTTMLHLVGVDTDLILENARAADNFGARVRKVRELVFEQAEIEQSDSLLPHMREVSWRGTKRRAEVLFTNVRTLAPEQFRPNEADWRLIIDFPFDEDPQWSPQDDHAALQKAQVAGVDVRTVVWLPAFLTPDAQKELGKLVLLDHVLSGSQLDTHGAHLSAQDRVQAKVLLQNQRESLRQTLILALHSAYGLSTTYGSMVDDTHGLETHFHTLAPGLTLQPPAAANFSDAVDRMMDQALGWQYPAHPDFAVELKTGSLRKVWEWIKRAAQTADGRVEVDRVDRNEMLRIAVPLGLGDMGEAHFVLKRQWDTHFTQAQASDGVTTVTVERVRRWLDSPRARGLPIQAQNLVILTWALLSNRSFHLHGASTLYDGTLDRLDRLPDELEVRPQALPNEETWTIAVRRAAELFGIDVPTHRSAQSLVALVQKVTEASDRRRDGVRRYAEAIGTALSKMEIPEHSSNRCLTARAARDLTIALHEQRGESLVRLLAEAEVHSSPTAMGEALAQGAALATLLERVHWDLLKSLRSLPNEVFGARVKVLTDQLGEALQNDEHVKPLSPAVDAFNREAFKLLDEVARMVNAEPTERTERAIEARADTGGTAKRRVVHANQIDIVVNDLRRDAQSNENAQFEVQWRIVSK